MTSGLNVQPVNSPHQVLVLANDSLLVEVVRSTLNAPGFEVRDAADPTTAAAVAAESRPDLAIVDLDFNHGGLLDWVAGRWPALVLTLGDDLAVRLDAFDRGADDVLVAPFESAELAARAGALLRRLGRSEPALMPVLRAGELEIDLVRRRTTRNGVDLGLTPVEQSLFYVLVANAKRVLSRDSILDAVWGPEYVSESNIVDRHIRNLRTKLHDDWHHPRFIATVTGQGYRFSVAIRPESRQPPESRSGGPERRPPLQLVHTARGSLEHQPWRMRAWG